MMTYLGERSIKVECALKYSLFVMLLKHYSQIAILLKKIQLDGIYGEALVPRSMEKSMPPSRARRKILSPIQY